MFFLADVNVAFQQSAHKVLLDDDNLLPLLHLTIEYHGKEHKGLLFLPVTLEFLLLIRFPISASIPHHRNHMILDLRNQVMQYYNSIEKKRKVQKSVEAKCDAQAMFLGGWVFFCHAAGMVPVYFQPPDFKAEERISRRPPKRTSRKSVLALFFVSAVSF